MVAVGYRKPYGLNGGENEWDSMGGTNDGGKLRQTEVWIGITLTSCLVGLEMTVTFGQA